MKLSKSKSNYRYFLFIAITFTFVFYSNLFAQTPDKPQKLLPNQPIERTIKGGETHVFEINLKKGEYARAEVEQKNIDVIVSLLNADGKLIVEMDGKDGQLWREAVSAIAENGDAVFQVKIRAYGESEQIGNYTIKLAEVRPANTKDRQRLKAEQHFYKGRKLYTQDKPDYENALKEFEAVLKIWQELGDKQWQAVAQYNVRKIQTDVNTDSENLILRIQRKIELEKIEKAKGSLSETEEKELDSIFASLEVTNKVFREWLEKLKKSEASLENRIAEVNNGRNLQKTLEKWNRANDSGAVAIFTVIGTDSEKDSDGKKIKEKTYSKFGWVILVTPNFQKAYPIDVKDLEATVFQLRNALSSDRYDPQPLAEKLYTAIFRQSSSEQKTTLEVDLEKILGNYKHKTIMWSLDGILRYIPMTVLHDGKFYLVEKFNNVGFTTESYALILDEDNPNGKILGLGLSNQVENFSPLPGVERELNEIVRTPTSPNGILEGDIKLNNEVTKELIFNSLISGKYAIVHIASHFSYDTKDPFASFLLLGDGRLTINDIKGKDNLFGSADLVVLSACETGTDGSFPYLLQATGAKTVLASLWKVSDAGTPELMIRFYKIRAENPQMSKGEAFRQAQLSLLKNLDKIGNTTFEKINRSTRVKEKGDATLLLWDNEKNLPLSHPYYWSSFILIGNWK